MFEEYEKYLCEISKYLDTLFEEQKPFIFCKEGCSFCCAAGQFPMSELEFRYLISGYEKLDESCKKIISNRIKKLKKNYKKNPEKRIEHSCPFLIGNKCSVYSFRPLICRTFGLIKSIETADRSMAAIIPECVHKNLNYSNVFDSFKGAFDEEKIKDFSVEPKIYDISLPVLWERKVECSPNFGCSGVMLEFLNSVTD